VVAVNGTATAQKIQNLSDTWPLLPSPFDQSNMLILNSVATKVGGKNMAAMNVNVDIEMLSCFVELATSRLVNASR
jgi:hypothetical protein